MARHTVTSSPQEGYISIVPPNTFIFIQRCFRMGKIFTHKEPLSSYPSYVKSEKLAFQNQC